MSEDRLRELQAENARLRAEADQAQAEAWERVRAVIDECGEACDPCSHGHCHAHGYLMPCVVARVLAWRRERGLPT